MMMISDLPDDLESEILSRVPAKSLWELRATCKRWYALFRDPRFVEKNKRLGKAVRASILLSNQDLYSVDKDLHDSSVFEEPPIEFTYKLRSLLKGSKDLKFSWIYHCDGLMLSQINEISRLVVWNPCTGQTRFIKPGIRYHRDDKYSLGYNKSSSGHSYKILRYCKNDQTFAECVIYELSSDSWRFLDPFPLDHNLCYRGISLNGDTYWIAQGKGEETGYFLMKFDFTTETFVRLPLPFQNLDPRDKATLSVVKDEKLSVLHSYILGGSTVMRIWVSNNVCEEPKDLSWGSPFVLKVLDLYCDGFYIPSVVNVASFLLDEENKVAICCDLHSVGLYEYKTRIYIVGDGMFKQVYNGTVEPFRCSFPRVITYVPSLVYIQTCTPKRGKKGRLAVK
ncbi:putative F-box/kelch-repeat protein At3g17540 [Raphanus sativus]|uniref:F-box/kelch-repeat protein At3g17540 n=1 Tax=Raphanus sativus TaxID=3726 RepID=A0A9W3DQL3_RAPSA|nr:putative F-box/kelch-repeat protein At3g17540 [Raphanus sativus]